MGRGHGRWVRRQLQTELHARQADWTGGGAVPEAILSCWKESILINGLSCTVPGS
jgi:hypothetical protein